MPITQRRLTFLVLVRLANLSGDLPAGDVGARLSSALPAVDSDRRIRGHLFSVGVYKWRLFHRMRHEQSQHERTEYRHLMPK
jgi:hypothetical protein